MTGFYNARGEVQQLDLSLTMYREAAAQGVSLPQFLAANYETDVERYGSVFQQLCAAEGVFVAPNRELGIRPSTMADILGTTTGAAMQGAANVTDAIPASRILFPAVFMQAVEDKLLVNLSMTAQAFDGMVAYDESIQGDRYEQPVINMDGPAQARSQSTAQLAKPASMITITASDKAYKIPSFAVGLEISDKVLGITNIDFVAMTLARQAAVERNERAQNYMMALYAGDIDNGEGSLASIGRVSAASSFDAASTAGALTQKAWIKFLTKDSTKRTITHVVTDIDGALAIENRTGRPTTYSDNPQSPRINTLMEVVNPLWPNQVKLFLTLDPAWPAGTIMGLDSNWGIRRVRSLTADYAAVEAYVMRRATGMRFDFGEHVNRMFDEAFDTLTLT